MLFWTPRMESHFSNIWSKRIHDSHCLFILCVYSPWFNVFAYSISSECVQSADCDFWFPCVVHVCECVPSKILAHVECSMNKINLTTGLRISSCYGRGWIKVASRYHCQSSLENEPGRCSKYRHTDGVFLIKTKQSCWHGIKPRILNSFYTIQTVSVFMILTNITGFGILNRVYIKFQKYKHYRQNYSTLGLVITYHVRDLRFISSNLAEVVVFFFSERKSPITNPPGRSLHYGFRLVESNLDTYNTALQKFSQSFHVLVQQFLCTMVLETME